MADKTEDYTEDWRDIRQGHKPLAVFERTGSADIWAQLQLAQDSGQYQQLLWWRHQLTDDRGQHTAAVAVARELSTLRQYQSLLQQQPQIPRAVFQRKLGQLFGYSADSIAAFVDSDTAASCRCTLCGRDDTAAAMAARRGQYHAS